MRQSFISRTRHFGLETACFTLRHVCCGAPPTHTLTLFASTESTSSLPTPTSPLGQRPSVSVYQFSRQIRLRQPPGMEAQWNATAAQPMEKMPHMTDCADGRPESPLRTITIGRSRRP